MCVCVMFIKVREGLIGRETQRSTHLPTPSHQSNQTLIITEKKFKGG